MFSALSRPSFRFRFSQAYAARYFTINKPKHQPKKERLHVLSEKVHLLHPYKTATVLDNSTKLSTMTTTTPSTIDLPALGNNFVKMVPTMEVIKPVTKLYFHPPNKSINIPESETRVSLEGHHDRRDISAKIWLRFLSTIGNGDQ